MCVVLPFWTESSEVCDYFWYFRANVANKCHSLSISHRPCCFVTPAASVIGRLETVQFSKTWIRSSWYSRRNIHSCRKHSNCDTHFLYSSIIWTTLSKTVGVGLEHCDPRLDISSLKNRIVKSDLHTTASHQQDRLEGQTSGGSHNWAQQYCTSPAG